MIRPASVPLIALVTIFAGCVSRVETAPPPAEPPSPVPPQEAAERVLTTMKEKVAAAEDLVALREENFRTVEAEFEAGRGSSVEVAAARAEIWEARIRALNYQQEVYLAERSGPLVLEAMREKVAAAEKVLEIREGIVSETEALVEAGRGPEGDLASVRGAALEDRIRVLNYRLDLEYAEQLFRMSGDSGNGK